MKEQGNDRKRMEAEGWQEAKGELETTLTGLRMAVPVDAAKGFALIAGPCSAETREQTLATARELHEAGVTVFRAGLWKPRTKPGFFEGCGAQGLDWLREVKAETGMLTATEIATPEHVEMALKAGVDILWLGARTTTNPFAVQRIADALQGSDAAILVKNPANPDLELWIGAIQRIYNAGIRRISAVHRGFSQYYPGVYRNHPQWQLPIELRHRIPSLQIISDPSHIGGKRDLIEPLAQEALRIGLDGLIVESHISPERALSDASQQITPHELSDIIGRLKPRHAAASATESINTLRQQIDLIDKELIEVLARRMSVVEEIGKLKNSENMTILQADRYKSIVADRAEQGSAKGLSKEFVSKIMSDIHAEAVRLQIEASGERAD